MTRIQGNEFTTGVQALYGDVNYDLNDPFLNDAGNVVGWLPGGSAFYSHSISDNLKIGVALFGNFGLSLSFNDDWAGKNLVKDATLMAATIQPTIAYRLNDKWSIGAGLGINVGYFSLTRDRLITKGGGEVTEDDADVAPSGKVGVLFELSERTRFGLTYSSKVDYSFDINATGTLPNGFSWTLPVDTSLSAPQQLMFSAVQVLNDKWSLLGEVGWQDWSTLSQAEVTINNETQSSSLKLQDTWHAAVGTQYQLTGDTRLNFGVAYDSSMYQNDNDTSFLLPAGSAWRFGTGVQHKLNENSSLGMAFEYVTSGDLSTTTPTVLAGSYDNPQMYFISANYSYHF